MAEHDGTPNGYVPARHPTRDEDSWHDAADERTEAGTDDEFADLDEIDARYLRTLATPSYDLGPQTDSFVVDLTAAESAASRHSMSFEQDVTGETEPVPAAQASLPSAAQGSLPNASTQPPIARPGIAPEPAFPPPATPHTATPSFDITPAAARPPETEFVIPPVPVGTSVLGAESLTAATVLKHRRARPQSGWRKRVCSVTGGRINFGLSPSRPPARRPDRAGPHARRAAVTGSRSSASRAGSARPRPRPRSARCSPTCAATGSSPSTPTPTAARWSSACRASPAPPCATCSRRATA